MMYTVCHKIKMPNINRVIPVYPGCQKEGTPLNFHQVLVKSDGNPSYKLSPKCKTRRWKVYGELCTIRFLH